MNLSPELGPLNFSKSLGEPDPEPDPYIGWGMDEPEPTERERIVELSNKLNVVLRNRQALSDLDPCPESFRCSPNCPRCAAREAALNPYIPIRHHIPGTPQQKA